MTRNELEAELAALGWNLVEARDPETAFEGRLTLEKGHFKAQRYSPDTGHQYEVGTSAEALLRSCGSSKYRGPAPLSQWASVPVPTIITGVKSA